MNIEKIKKDWEQHCKHMEHCGVYSRVAELSDNYLEFSLGSNNMLVDLEYIQATKINCYASDDMEMKLFTTFYEKLMEASDAK